MNIRILIVGMAALAIGFFAGRRSSATVTKTIAAEQPKLQNLQRLVDVDLQDYYRLKSEEERYKKADEILGKMISLFLADLGLKISKPASVVGTQPIPEAHPPATSQSATGSTNTITTGLNAKPDQSSVPSRTLLADVRSPNDIADFLKASQVDHFEEDVKTSTPFADRNGQLQNLIGRFVGTAQIASKGESEQWGVDMVLNAKISTGKLTGQRSLKLSKNGKVFSDSNGTGALDEDYREVSRDPDAIIVAAGPNSFLQAYYVRNTDQVIGSVMRKDGVSGPYKSIGTLELNRR